MTLIAIQPPQSSELLPGHSTVQLLEGIGCSVTESPHMHCLPFSTPARFFLRLAHANMHCSRVMPLLATTTSPRIRAPGASL